jgi:hypothetical protein
MVCLTVIVLTKMNIGGDGPWRAAVVGGEKRVTTIGILTVIPVG